MNRTIFVLVMMVGLLLVLPLVLGEVQSLPTQKKGYCVIIPQTCSNCTYVNITSIKYPNSTESIINVAMTQTAKVKFNYTFCGTEQLGDYIVTTCGNPDSTFTCVDYDFEVSPTGFSISDGQSTTSLGLIFAIIIIAGLFMFFGYKMSENNKTFPFGLFMLLVSFILVIYSFHLGYLYSRDIIYPMAIDGTQFKVYIGVMWGLIGMALLAMTFLTFKVVKEIKEKKEQGKYGEGWNSQSRQFN